MLALLTIGTLAFLKVPAAEAAPVNLASMTTLKASTSGMTYAVRGMFDGCTSTSSACTTGSNAAESFYMDFDFGGLQNISEASLFGDADGTWVSQYMTVQHKRNATDAWTTAINKTYVKYNAWVRKPVSLSARYVRVIVYGAVGSRAVQARELRLIGSPATLPTPTPAPSPTPTPVPTATPTPTPPAGAKVHSVGPGKTFANPCAAFSSASVVDGDIVEIDANATYTGGVLCAIKKSLTIRGVGGRAKMNGNGATMSDKGIWNTYAPNIVIENIEFYNAKSGGCNGAGIRHEGGRLTVRNSYFHHNQMGLLSAAISPDTEVKIENSEFGHQSSTCALSHNIYMGSNGIKKFTLIGSYLHHADDGHLTKSRAQETYILYNRFTESTLSGYAIDIPDGGVGVVVGNMIHQSATEGNSNVMAYGLEGLKHSANQLYVVNNTFVNDKTGGTFVAASSAAAPVVIRNNILAGPGAVTSQAGAIVDRNCATTSPGFVNKAGFDWRLTATSPCRDQGVSPGTTQGGFNLTPVRAYTHPTQTSGRPVNGALDAGAYEY